MCEAILQSGEKLSRTDRADVPLKYTWHGKEYIGAAHGYFGIFYILLQVVSHVWILLDNFDFYKPFTWYRDLFLSPPCWYGIIVAKIYLSKPLLSKMNLSFFKEESAEDNCLNSSTRPTLLRSVLLI